MNNAIRFKLIGTYRAPRFKIGQVVMDELRGEVKITGMTDGKIIWPIGRRVGTSLRPGAVLYCDILRAIKRESRQAVAHWFGVSPWQVGEWRRQLGIAGEYTEGTHKLRVEFGKQPWFKRAQRKAWAKASDPERCEKIAATKRGKRRPPHVVEAIRKAVTGRTHTADSRQKMSVAHKARGTRPPWLNSGWTKREDDLLRKFPVAEVAKRTGRTVLACRLRRRKLGLASARSVEAG